MAANESANSRRFLATLLSSNQGLHPEELAKKQELSWSNLYESSKEITEDLVNKTSRNNDYKDDSGDGFLLTQPADVFRSRLERNLLDSKQFCDTISSMDFIAQNQSLEAVYHHIEK